MPQPVPVRSAVAALAVMLAACGGGDQPPAQTAATEERSAPSAAPVADAGYDVRKGQEVYVTCMSCHQLDGAGVSGTYPPLAGSAWVTGDPRRVIAIVLHGLQGRIVVNGATYDNVMAPWGTVHDDAAVAAVVSYIRTQWGNSASIVTAEDVKAIRDAHATRTQPWTEAELNAAFK